MNRRSVWAVVGVCLTFAVSLGVLGLHKYGNTRILAVAWSLVAAELLILAVMIFERKELPQSRTRRRTAAYILVLLAGVFAPANMFLYFYGIHPSEYVSGVIWMYGSALLCPLAMLFTVIGPKLRLWDGWLVPMLLAGIVMGSTIDYIVWISGG